MQVTVTRHRRTYQRSSNGAWLRGPTSQPSQHTVDLSELRNWTVGDGWLDVTFPDGTKETLFADTATHTGAERKFSYGTRLNEMLKEVQDAA